MLSEFRIKKEVVEATGLSQDTIRFYEKQGLISKPERQINGYRHYSHDIVMQLNMIHRAKTLGFSLKEIQELTALLFSKKLTQQVMAEQLLIKRADISQKIQALEVIRQEIDDALAGRCEHRKQLNKNS